MNGISTASAPGRVCFAGEDIDWISGPAVLGVIGLRLEVTVSPLRGGGDFILLKSGSPFCVERRVRLSEVGRYGKHVMSYVEAAVKVLMSRGVEIAPVEISVTSRLPACVGLSSSAAVTVASLAALAEFHGLRLSTREVCGMAYSVESEELKTGAGQMDFYACGLGGFLYIDSASVPPHPIERYDFPPDVAVIIADTMAPRATADVIRVKRERLRRAEPGIVSYVRHTEAVISELRQLLREPELPTERFGALIASAHEYLDKYMRVSTDLLNACVAASLRNGALGAKLTGTGMGGCMFAVAPVSEAARVQKALAEYPVKTYVTGISNEGLTVGRT